MYILPITALLSEPKAHIQWAPPGTWNLQKLHFDWKYFGRKPAPAKLKPYLHILLDKQTDLVDISDTSV